MKKFKKNEQKFGQFKKMFVTLHSLSETKQSENIETLTIDIQE